MIHEKILQCSCGIARLAWAAAKMKKEGDLLEINRWDLLEKVSVKEGGYSGGCSRAIRTIRLQQKPAGLLASQGRGASGSPRSPKFSTNGGRRCQRKIPDDPNVISPTSARKRVYSTPERHDVACVKEYCQRDS